MAPYGSRQARAETIDLLPPERPAASRRPRQHSSGHADVVDAEFVVINDNRKPAQDQRPSFSRPKSRDARTVSGRDIALWGVSFAERMLERLPKRQFSGLVAASFLAVFAFSGGFSALAGGASVPASVSPLDITHVTVTPQMANGMHVLLVNGIIENRLETDQQVPRLRADILADGELTASLILDPPADELSGGTSRGFAAKLSYPGGKQPDVRVSFMQ
ncbi:hypothetical protein [Rhizobium sp. NRK18]|uniref:hypothetical protein n=1 Tax=Rhizobium sp. NRK18 TaxID=2964667 RepID=UPI0021C446D7|nr:hypothetical protein [Rhizobium sp. NRK18]MCQ2003070.1 hypothetical protein [Rhizobium sp. NRK18]